MIPKRYDKFGTVKILTVSRKQWYKNFENPSNFIFIVHLLIQVQRVSQQTLSAAFGGCRHFDAKYKIYHLCFAVLHSQ